MRTLIPILMIGLLASCAAERSRLGMDYGTSYKLATEQQTLNPEAAKNLEPVEGIDAKTSEAILKNYYKGLEPAKKKTGTSYQVTKESQ
jgi:hypothetical protein